MSHLLKLTSSQVCQELQKLTAQLQSPAADITAATAAAQGLLAQLLSHVDTLAQQDICDAVCSFLKALLQLGKSITVPALPGVYRLLAHPDRALRDWAEHCLNTAAASGSDGKLGAAALDSIVKPLLLLWQSALEARLYTATSSTATAAAAAAVPESAEVISTLRGLQKLLSLLQSDAKAAVTAVYTDLIDPVVSVLDTALSSRTAAATELLLVTSSLLQQLLQQDVQWSVTASRPVDVLNTLHTLCGGEQGPLSDATFVAGCNLVPQLLLATASSPASSSSTSSSSSSNSGATSAAAVTVLTNRALEYFVRRLAGRGPSGRLGEIQLSKVADTTCRRAFCSVIQSCYAVQSSRPQQWPTASAYAWGPCLSASVSTRGGTAVLQAAHAISAVLRSVTDRVCSTAIAAAALTVIDVSDTAAATAEQQYSGLLPLVPPLMTVLCTQTPVLDLPVQIHALMLECHGRLTLLQRGSSNSSLLLQQQFSQYFEPYIRQHIQAVLTRKTLKSSCLSVPAVAAWLPLCLCSADPSSSTYAALLQLLEVTVTAGSSISTSSSSSSSSGGSVHGAAQATKCVGLLMRLPDDCVTAMATTGVEALVQGLTVHTAHSYTNWSVMFSTVAACIQRSPPFGDTAAALWQVRTTKCYLKLTILSNYHYCHKD
jgi:hypothetical protein